MAYFQVEGGHRLHGEITPQGAKNEALQILCATLLTPRRVVVHNVPRILDVMQLIDLLRAMGVDPDAAQGALRVSMGRGTTEADAEAFLEAMPRCLEWR